MDIKERGPTLKGGSVGPRGAALARREWKGGISLAREDELLSAVFSEQPPGRSQSRLGDRIDLCASVVPELGNAIHLILHDTQPVEVRLSSRADCAERWGTAATGRYGDLLTAQRAADAFVSLLHATQFTGESSATTLPIDPRPAATWQLPEGQNGLLIDQIVSAKLEAGDPAGRDQPAKVGLV